MDQKLFLKQMIEVNKTTFDATFDATNKLQEQMETLISGLVAQASWLPKDGEKTIDEWVTAYKTGREEFKKTVDQNFSKVLDYFGEAKKTESSGKPAPKKDK